MASAALSLPGWAGIFPKVLQSNVPKSEIAGQVAVNSQQGPLKVIDSVIVQGIPKASSLILSVTVTVYVPRVTFVRSSVVAPLLQR